ncbi:hypothetical protein BJ912DRAFT_934375 [Pholiota molesta]|nr:hypothetical protein BJ912DRAFT_934375 [Pholiota molesta]
MGRTKIHLTVEAQREANRAKSKRHYDKSKAAINAQRRKTYRKTHPNTAKLRESAAISLVTQETRSPITVWMEHAERLKRRLNNITNGSPKTFVNDACQQYMLSLNSEPLDGHVRQLEEVQTAITQCHNEVLQLAGVGPELEQVDELSREVRMVISWIDEILYTLLEDGHNLNVFKTYLEGKRELHSSCMHQEGVHLGTATSTCGMWKSDRAGGDHHDKASRESFVEGSLSCSHGRIPAIAGAADPGNEGLCDVPVGMISLG